MSLGSADFQIGGCHSAFHTFVFDWRIRHYSTPFQGNSDDTGQSECTGKPTRDHNIVDPPDGAIYDSKIMSSNKKTDGAELNLEELETRVDDLIDTISRLRKENISLRTRQEDLMSERAALIEKSEQAKSRLESMIGRLKSMESK